MITSILKPPVSIADLIINPPPVTGQTGSQIVDFPYIYVFDGTGLTNGTSPTDNNVTIQSDADFYLRRIFGVPYVASKFKIRQAYGKTYQSDPMIMPNNYAFSRELKFEAQSSIRFDLGTVAKLTNGGVPLAYIGFQGAKRMILNALPYQTPYPFKRLPAAHNFSLALNWKYANSPIIRTQTMMVQNYDFELHKIEIVTTAGATDLGNYRFAMQLFDAYGNQTSNLPVLADWINARICGITNAAPYDSLGLMSSIFPVPPLLYPRNSMIRFDIQSLIPASLATANFVINFSGFDRYPLAS